MHTSVSIVLTRMAAIMNTLSWRLTLLNKGRQIPRSVMIMEAVEQGWNWVLVTLPLTVPPSQDRVKAGAEIELDDISEVCELCEQCACVGCNRDQELGDQNLMQESKAMIAKTCAEEANDMKKKDLSVKVVQVHTSKKREAFSYVKASRSGI